MSIFIFVTTIPILTNLKNGELLSPASLTSKNLSARNPSATISTTLLAGAGRGVEYGVIPCIIGDLKYTSKTEYKNTEWITTDKKTKRSMMDLKKFFGNYENCPI